MSSKGYTLLIPIMEEAIMTIASLSHTFCKYPLPSSKLKYVVFIHLFSAGRSVSSFSEGLSTPQKTWVLTEDQCSGPCYVCCYF